MIERVADCYVSVSDAGVLWVETTEGQVFSVLPTGTHAALNPLGKSRKAQLVRWWKQHR